MRFGGGEPNIVNLGPSLPQEREKWVEPTQTKGNEKNALQAQEIVSGQASRHAARQRGFLTLAFHEAGIEPEATTIESLCDALFDCGLEIGRR